MSDDDRDDGTRPGGDARVLPFPERGDASYVPPPIPTYPDAVPPTDPDPEPLQDQESGREFPPIPVPDPAAALRSEGIPDVENAESEENPGEDIDGEYVHRRSFADRIGDWLELRVVKGQARFAEEQEFRQAELARKVALMQARTDRDVGMIEANGKLRQARVKGRGDRAAARGKADTGGSRGNGGGSGGGGKGSFKPSGGRGSGGSGSSGARNNSGGPGGGSGRRSGSGSGGAPGSGGSKGTGRPPAGSGSGRGAGTAAGAKGSGGGSSGKGSGGTSPGGGKSSGGKGSSAGKGSGGGKDSGGSSGTGKSGGKSPGGDSGGGGKSGSSGGGSAVKGSGGKASEGPFGGREKTSGSKDSTQGSKGSQKGSKGRGDGNPHVDPDTVRRVAWAIRREDDDEAERILKTCKDPQATFREAMRLLDDIVARDTSRTRDDPEPEPDSDSDSEDREPQDDGDQDRDRSDTDRDRRDRDGNDKAGDRRTRERIASFLDFLRNLAEDRLRRDQGPPPSEAEPTVFWDAEVVDEERRPPHEPGTPGPRAAVAPRALAAAPEPHTERPGTTRPPPPDEGDHSPASAPVAFDHSKEDTVSSRSPANASAQGGLAARHRTDVTFDSYLMDMADIALDAKADQERAHELADALKRVSKACRAMSADLIHDHNIDTRVTSAVSELADAADRLRLQADRCADDCEAAYETAADAARDVGRVYGQDMNAKEDAGLRHTSAAAHHD
ncbi:hypothetical protein [Embleya sp. NPDC020630]|uniref:hypothetical protein n=1 Tax=Embleya sp. NPDC020630 TaxID=3363979 RepID=UPI00379694C0